MATYYTETKNRISAALWLLMEKDTLENITITMICQEAHIGRRSFYRHFQNKRDVITFSFRLKNDEFSEHCSGIETMEDMIGKSMQYYRTQKQFLRLIQRNGILTEFNHVMQQSGLFSKMLDIFMIRCSLPPYLREYVANVIATTHTSLLMTWADHNFKEDWREIAAFEVSMFSAMKQ